MYTDLQISAIKLFGRKDLTKGLLGIRTTGEPCEYNGEYWEAYGHGLQDKNPEILGHIPHLEDLFRVLYKKGFTGEFQKSIGKLVISKSEHSPLSDKYIFYRMDMPLLDQPSLPEIISLFK